MTHARRAAATMVTVAALVLVSALIWPGEERLAAAACQEECDAALAASDEYCYNTYANPSAELSQCLQSAQAEWTSCSMNATYCDRAYICVAWWYPGSWWYTDCWYQ